MGTEEEDRPVEDPGAAAKLAAFLMVLAVVAVLVFLIKDLYPEDLATRADPGFIDSIFDNKVVVLFARLLLVSGALVLAI